MNRLRIAAASLFVVLLHASGAAGEAKRPDLDVFYIKRLPAYAPGPWVYPATGAQYLGDPATGRPFTPEELRTTHKQRPSKGEKVEFTAVVENKSPVACGAFGYAWRLDGRRIASGSRGRGTRRGTRPASSSTRRARWRSCARQTTT